MADRVPEPRPEVEGRRLSQAIAGTRSYLLSLQREDGHWCAELEGDTILESEYILAMHFLGRSGEEKVRKAASFLRQRQLPTGGWAIYPGGTPDLSASVKAYFVLKLVGDDPQSPHMERAREVILSMGGLVACNSFTKIYLSIFGQYEWSKSPGVPPELILFPKWFPFFNIYDMSSWSRAIVVPLSIIWAKKPHCPVPEHATIRELRVRPRGLVLPQWSRASLMHEGWSLFFRVLDRIHKMFESAHLVPLRRRAIRLCEQWVLARLDKSDGLGAIFPPIVNTIIALRSLGYPEDHPTVVGQIRELEKLELEEEETMRLQPCFSPVWDTALSLNALAESEVPQDREQLYRAIEWLLDREVREPGDWRVRNPEGPVGGWYFEYANEFYPDCDDTAQILTAVSKVDPPGGEIGWRLEAANKRALGWLLSMQNRDGGWASFDKGCNKEYLTYIPFADHNAMIDPSTTDITARALEALARHGYDLRTPAVRRGVDFVRRDQQADGSWYGRWGCNYLYGTWLALCGLEAVGEDLSQDYIRRAAAWIRSCQNPDGGWGELPDSYEDASKKGQGPSTAAQTAWAIMGLIAAGEVENEAVARGVDYLLSTQHPDGSWTDAWWTGTGFPEVFYLNYHYYAIYFPLQALETYRKRLQFLERSATGYVGPLSS
ncbi:MAG: squalene--hopene cyclase [Acidobacteria bacterium]|nr:MAG: squalene--hopene cyclase [Acidobacteriota bacterium]